VKIDIVFVGKYQFDQAEALDGPRLLPHSELPCPQLRQHVIGNLS
jgi:hypothetical protein